MFSVIIVIIYNEYTFLIRIKRLIIDSESMEKAMLNNMIEKTGNYSDKLILINKKQNFNNKKEIIIFLKQEHSVGHFYVL